MSRGCGQWWPVGQGYSVGPACTVFMTSEGSGTPPLPVTSLPKTVTASLVVLAGYKDSKEFLALGSCGSTCLEEQNAREVTTDLQLKRHPSQSLGKFSVLFIGRDSDENLIWL